jgi:hypothetical protein
VDAEEIEPVGSPCGPADLSRPGPQAGSEPVRARAGRDEPDRQTGQARSQATSSRGERIAHGPESPGGLT